MLGKAIFLLITLLTLTGFGSCSGGGSTAGTPSQTPPPSTSPQRVLKSTVTCTDSESFDENAYVTFAYSVAYVRSNYSDSSTSVSCEFSAISVNTHPSGGTCSVPISGDGLSNDLSEPVSPCMLGVSADFIYGLSCPEGSPYVYTFNVQAIPAENWLAFSPIISISASNCVEATY